jgi:uncharacterized protein
MLKKCFALLVLASWAFCAEPVFPELTDRVVDEVGLLNEEQHRALSQKLEAVEKNSSAQVVVAILKTLNGYDIADYGYRLGRHWKIGQKGANNGAILIVAPYEKKIRIEVGYGLEDRLTDAVAHTIINEAVLPRFKNKDVFGGLDAGVSQIAIAINTTAPEKSAVKDGNGGKQRSLNTFFVVIAMMLVPIMFIVLWATKTLIQNKTARKTINGTLAGLIAAGITWILFFMLGVSIIAAVIFFIIGFLIDDKQKSDTTFGDFVSGGFNGFSGGSSSDALDVFTGGGGDFGGGGASADIIGSIMDGL